MDSPSTAVAIATSPTVSSPEGLAVRAPDHRGHGRSEGKRTSVVRFDDYVDDLTAVIAGARDAVAVGCRSSSSDTAWAG